MEPPGVGGIIGRLAAEDPDSPPEAITFRLGWPDEAWFEIVDGNLLKLREGVDLLREGGTIREVVVLVSDGINEAARIVGVQVLNVTDEDDTPAPEEPPPPPPPPEENRPPDPLQPGQSQHGFAFVWPTVVGTLRFSWEAELVLTGPDGLTLIRLKDGNDVWLPRIDLLHMGDGDLHFAPDGIAAQIIRLYDAILDRPPDVPGLLYYIGVMRAGASLADVATGFLNSPEFLARFGGLSNADLVTARALAPLPDLLPLVARHLAPGGATLLPKGATADAELTAAAPL
ncbi:MAG: DUF4214 domain-containing protein, partial [Elioraea tepidiphila]